MTRDCEKCGGVVQQIPAGTAGPNAKNPGKSYDAFWSCQNQSCPSKTGVPRKETVDTNGNGKRNAAVEIIFELQGIRAILERIEKYMIETNKPNKQWMPPQQPQQLSEELENRYKEELS